MCYFQTQVGSIIPHKTIMLTKQDITADHKPFQFPSMQKSNFKNRPTKIDQECLMFNDSLIDLLVYFTDYYY